MQKWIPLSLTMSTALSLATDVQANCARPVGYQATVSANTVEVQAINFADRTCPDPSGMLRQNLATGEVVKIADYCLASTDGGNDAAYIDECVAVGTYRYGFGKPYDCVPSACGTDYFVEVTVANPLDPNCARNSTDPGPTPATGAPWSNAQSICEYGGVETPASCTASSGAARASTVVLGLQALALFMGVVFMKRRRSAANGR